MNKKPTDPLTTTKEYTYSKLTYGNAYQIKSDWEGESIAFNKEPGNRDQRLVEEKEARFFSQDTFSKLLTSHFSLLTSHLSPLTSTHREQSLRRPCRSI